MSNDGTSTRRASKPYQFIQADATRLPFADQTFDLVFGSPPYCDARTYGINAQRGCIEWVEWMIQCTLEAQRVCKGPVLWVAAGVTRKRNYWPACEGLMWEWWKRGGDCQLYRPCYWHRVGIPGSGGDDWFRADVEYVMCFKRPGALAWSDNTANGHPPKWGPGGEMSYRQSSGTRRNAWGQSPNQLIQCRMKNGERDTRVRSGRTEAVPLGEMVARDGQGPRGITRRAIGTGERSEEIYNPPVLANPGNFPKIGWDEDELEYLRVLKVVVGGGVMGHAYSHDNEAPFPIDVPRWFIKSLCKPAGLVLDPFSGSGTTVDAAVQEGRIGIGTDIRQSQCELGLRRMRNPYARKEKRQAKPHEHSLFNLGGGEGEGT